MPQGTVKWYNPVKGYGFIQPADGGKDVFVHATALERSQIDTRNFKENMKVEFEITQGRDNNKQSAENIKLV